jgi:magnesium transporter
MIELFKRLRKKDTSFSNTSKDTALITHDKHNISAIAYNSKKLKELKIGSIDELLQYENKDYTIWVNITGLENIGIIEDIGKYFKIHPIVIADILNIHQRVKFEDYQDYLFLVFKKLNFKEKSTNIRTEQVSVLILENFVFTFNESSDSRYEFIKKRLSNAKSPIRNAGISHLVYTIINAIVDQYFSLVDNFENISETIDNELQGNFSDETLNKIQKLKRELILAKRSIAPLKEILQYILKSDSLLINNKTRFYYSDVYDHTIRALELLDICRELGSSLHDVYLSKLNNSMNAIMKVLAIFGSIFIPLTFIAGIYGMNFKHMPELGWEWSYPLVWCAFLCIIAAQLIFFRRKKWL